MTYCLTNFEIEEEKTYIKAIEMYKEKYNKDVLVISDEAYDISGNKLNTCKSLKVTVIDCDLTEFWKIFDSIRQI